MEGLEKNRQSTNSKQNSIFIAPSILSADFTQIGQAVEQIEQAQSDWIHIDVMDGHFVPQLTFGSKMLMDIQKKTQLPLDVHLMVSNPQVIIDAYLDAQADCYTFHWEALIHHHRLIQYIHQAGFKAGVAIVPSTDVRALECILPSIDRLLIMSVNPGFGGQEFIPHSLEKIRQAQEYREKLGLHYTICVDGGVHPHNVGSIVQAGAQALISGSGFFSAQDKRSYVRTLKQLS